MTPEEEIAQLKIQVRVLQSDVETLKNALTVAIGGLYNVNSAIFSSFMASNSLHMREMADFKEHTASINKYTDQISQRASDALTRIWGDFDGGSPADPGPLDSDVLPNETANNEGLGE